MREHLYNIIVSRIFTSDEDEEETSSRKPEMTSPSKAEMTSSNIEDSSKLVANFRLNQSESSQEPQPDIGQKQVRGVWITTALKMNLRIDAACCFHKVHTMGI